MGGFPAPLDPNWTFGELEKIGKTFFLGIKNRFFGDFWESVAGALRADLDPLSSAKFAYDSILKVVSRFPAPLGLSVTSCKTRKIGKIFFRG